MTKIEDQIQLSKTIFEQWKHVPAPVRGELMRVFGSILREQKEGLARQITDDMGKTIRESRGEIQEAIDMCDFAVGLSRQLYGLTMPSERPDHRIQEQWLPLGPVGVITAFNFPAAVWAWNFCIAAVCGNTVIWKPSAKAPKIAELMHHCWGIACKKAGYPQFSDVSIVLNDTSNNAARILASSEHIPLVSATGSTEMGKVIGQLVAARLGKCILELGGNNAAVVSQHCDLDLAVKSSVFSAVGTTGQRCTTLRRAFVHRSIFDEYVSRMVNAYKTIKIGDPHDEDVLIGPLVSEDACLKGFDAMQIAEFQGGTVVTGNPYLPQFGEYSKYMAPTIITAETHLDIMHKETFAPILYVVPYNTIDEAINLVNCVPQGLSSCIFSNNILEIEKFMKLAYTGIVNINNGTSGAEIGGAFGGEKDTGGGRESGSDAWKTYMRRATSTINFSGTIALAQGVDFS